MSLLERTDLTFKGDYRLDNRSRGNYLFISNGNKLDQEIFMSREPYKLNNVSLPCLRVAKSLGYKVYVGINRFFAEDIRCENAEVFFYYAGIYRNIFDFKSNIAAYKRLMLLLRERPFDVIHCNTPIGGALGRICGKKARVRKIIYTAHGFHFYKGASPVSGMIFKWAERIMAGWTDAILTMNEEDYQAAKQFKLRNNGKVYKIPGVGIDLDEFAKMDVDRNAVRAGLGLRPEDVVLISAGDLIKRKNYSVALDALAKLKHRDLHYIICGEGPEKDRLVKQTELLGLSKNVHFLGFRSDIRELMSASDIFIMTSYQEGLPRALMEAMALGLPCIVSEIRGNVDLIQNGMGGLLCSPKNANTVASAIQYLIQRAEIRKEMGSYNLKAIKDYDVEKVDKAIQGIYEEML